jgi:glyoxylase-like metal-dependent hydrolase (beta-lactamase superfamily II)
VIIGDDGVTVFDGNARPSTSRQVIAEIRKLTDRPVRTLINSHWHMDHWLGNQEYASAYPGLQIIATSETREYMKRLPLEFFVNGLGLARTRALADTAIRTGKLPDGRALTPALRQELENDVKRTADVTAEISATRQVYPTLTFSDSLTLFSASREMRLFSATGDASGSTVLYLPTEKLLVTGDVLVRNEDDRGVQPWTTNSYKITPWLASLRALEAMDVTTIVPGQGGVLRDKAAWVKLFKTRFRFTGGEIVGEFLMSLGYLPGAHREDCPAFKRVARLDPVWMRHRP